MSQCKIQQIGHFRVTLCQSFQNLSYENEFDLSKNPIKSRTDHIFIYEWFCKRTHCETEVNSCFQFSVTIEKVNL